jgi:hypothetical protein
LERNQRQNAIAYMRSWANLVEGQLPTQFEDSIGVNRLHFVYFSVLP